MAFTNPNTTDGVINWEQCSYNFTATGSSTTITFLNGTTNSNEAGLDNVSLLEAPEPSSLAFFAAALSLLGLLMAWKRWAKDPLTKLF
jgi:hypothetical protein